MPKLILDACMIDASGIGTYLQNSIPYLKNQINITLYSIYFPYEQIEFVLKIKKGLKEDL